MKTWLSITFQTLLPEARMHLSLLVFRMVLSISLFIVHGLPKIADFEAEVANIPDPFGFGQYPSALLAVFANLVCPVLVALGAFTRPAILPILAVTLTGYFIVHGGDPAKARDVPFMYSLAFGLLMAMGPGKYSVDAWLEKRLLLPKSSPDTLTAAAYSPDK